MNGDQRTRAQRQAATALARIRRIEQRSAAQRKEYKARADSFPVLVLQAGLAQAVGFMRAKAAKNPAYGDYLDDLAAVLGLPAGQDELQRRAIDDPLRDYRQLTRQTLAAAGWLKRFGQACLSSNNGDQP